MNPEYSIIPQPRTKPPRFMLAANDRIIAKSLLRSDARKIVAGLELARLQPEAAKDTLNRLTSAGL